MTYYPDYSYQDICPICGDVAAWCPNAAWQGMLHKWDTLHERVEITYDDALAAFTAEQYETDIEREEREATIAGMWRIPDTDWSRGEWAEHALTEAEWHVHILGW